MKSLLKETVVQVGLNDQDTRDLDKIVERERREKKDLTIGRATVVRELVMPLIRERLADEVHAG